jgi:NADH:ubiquinone oxidoreductase subunit E
LRGSAQIVAALESNLGIGVGETSEDGSFTFSEMECLGACVNAPMMQVNDDYYEDLDENSAVLIVTELLYGRKPQTGSQIARKSCEPIGGLTSLIEKET